jgi:hypothetical protein
MRNLVEGETAPVDATLYDGDGASRTVVNGTGLTITLHLRDRTGALVNVTGAVSWVTPSAGLVRYEPAAEDLKAERSPYKARFKVTDSFSDEAFYPNGEADVWVVRK